MSCAALVKIKMQCSRTGILRMRYFFISGAPVCQAWPTFSPMA